MSHNRYIHFFTDFAFTRLFGSEPGKLILLDFLNELLYPQQGRIVSLTVLKHEHFGLNAFDSKAIYDLHCVNERGENFLVEVQHTNHNYVKEVARHYATFPIGVAPGAAGEVINLKPIYLVALIGFTLKESRNEPEKYRHNVRLADVETGKVIDNKQTFIYLEIPKFAKTEAELDNRLEQWLYVFKNLHTLEQIPDFARDAVFEEFFHLAEIARFTHEEQNTYNDSLKLMQTYFSKQPTVLEEAKAEGLASEV